jgi:hypothetical protein
MKFLPTRAHVGGRFGQRSHLVKVDFALSLVKSEVQVACNFEESPYVATHIFSPLVIYENVNIVFIEIYRIR